MTNINGTKKRLYGFDNSHLTNDAIFAPMILKASLVYYVKVVNRRDRVTDGKIRFLMLVSLRTP